MEAYDSSRALMKDGVVLINTSQGKVIEEKALVQALKSGKIAYAGLDVLEEEPREGTIPCSNLITQFCLPTSVSTLSKQRRDA